MRGSGIFCYFLVQRSKAWLFLVIWSYRVPGPFYSVLNTADNHWDTGTLLLWASDTRHLSGIHGGRCEWHRKHKEVFCRTLGEDGGDAILSSGSAWMTPILFPWNGRSFIRQAYVKLSLRVGIPGSWGKEEAWFANAIYLIFLIISNTFQWDSSRLPK